MTAANLLSPPRWPLTSWLGALLLTMLIFIVLPLQYRPSPPPMTKPQPILRPVSLYQLPEPPPTLSQPVQHTLQTAHHPIIIPNQNPIATAPSVTVPLNITIQPLPLSPPASSQLAMPVYDFSGLDAPEQVLFELDEVDAPPIPIKRAPPVYPTRERMRHIEGHVRVEFTVSAAGRVTDISVTDAKPAGTFEKAATDTIQHWTFQPAQKNGQPVDVRVRQTITFSLN
ncbi:MAG: energy transducer TonB [Spartobacteria bacterium]|nr:energy transducer TonB [Spartobacteria bacterium]